MCIQQTSEICIPGDNTTSVYVECFIRHLSGQLTNSIAALNNQNENAHIQLLNVCFLY